MRVAKSVQQMIGTVYAMLTSATAQQQARRMIT
jgi:hypothetical protein